MAKCKTHTYNVTFRDEGPTGRIDKETQVKACSKNAAIKKIIDKYVYPTFIRPTIIK